MVGNTAMSVLLNLSHYKMGELWLPESPSQAWLLKSAHLKMAEIEKHRSVISPGKRNLGLRLLSSRTLSLVCYLPDVEQNATPRVFKQDSQRLAILRGDDEPSKRWKPYGPPDVATSYQPHLAWGIMWDAGTNIWKAPPFFASGLEQPNIQLRQGLICALKAKLFWKVRLTRQEMISFCRNTTVVTTMFLLPKVLAVIPCYEHATEKSFRKNCLKS